MVIVVFGWLDGFGFGKVDIGIGMSVVVGIGCFGEFVEFMVVVILVLFFWVLLGLLYRFVGWSGWD